jgi:hypothetical protein
MLKRHNIESDRNILINLPFNEMLNVKLKIQRMRKRTIKFHLFLCLFMTILLISCAKDDGTTDITTTKTSHKAGQNCMSCHVGGFGGGAWTVAGTVYNSSKSSIYSNATVKLTTGTNGTGTVAATILGDASGNFYTKTGVSFTGGLYPSVTGTTGNTQYMPTSVTTGQCNSCHNNTTAKIWVN